jgi:hypothetical protein
MRRVSCSIIACCRCSVLDPALPFGPGIGSVIADFPSDHAVRPVVVEPERSHSRESSGVVLSPADQHALLLDPAGAG